MLTGVQGAVMVGAFSAERLAQALSRPLPESLASMLREKRVMICAAAFFMGNTVRSMLTSTGAFEIYAGDQVVSVVSPGPVRVVFEMGNVCSGYRMGETTWVEQAVWCGGGG